MQNLDKSYIEILDTLKQKIRTAQLKAGLAVNTEMWGFIVQLKRRKYAEVLQCA